MKRLLFKTLLCLIIAGVPVCLASAQTEFDRETFRVSPPAVYKYINLKQRDLATIGTTCTDDGLLYYDTKNMIVMCQKSSFSPYSLFWEPLPGVWKQDGNKILATDIRTTGQAMRVAIGTNAPVLGLTIAGDGGIMAKGTLNYGTTMLSDPDDLPVDEAFPLFLWHAQKGSLVAMETIGYSSGYNNFEEIIGFNATMFGHGNVAKGRGAFVAGESNVANGYRSVVAGGQQNTIRIPAAMADDNQAWTETGDYGIFNAHRHARTTSVIMGGFSNDIYGIFNFIGGGNNNTLDQTIYAAIGGGKDNTIDDSIADTYMANTLNDGPSNTTIYANATLSVILGGEGNTVSSKKSAIGGGKGNTISSSSTYNAIIGGQTNTISGSAQYSAIGGGLENSVTRSYAGIGGGYRNRVQADYSTVIGGVPVPVFSGSAFSSFSTTDPDSYGNTVTGQFSVIGGGVRNTVSGIYSTIPGGKKNTVTGDYGFAGCATGCNITGDYGAIASNASGTISGDYGFIGQASGYASGTLPTSTASGAYSVALQTGTVSGDYSLLFDTSGSNSTINRGKRTFFFTYGGTVGSSVQDAFIIDDQGDSGSYVPRVAIGKDNPQRPLDVNGTIQTHSLQITGGGLTGLVTKQLLRFNTSTTPWTLFRQSDIAETFPTDQIVEPGDVLVASSQTAGHLTKSAAPYDKTVIGVVSVSPAIIFKGNELIALPDEKDMAETTQPAVALAGRVLIKVTTENGPIEPGDLLTSSSQSGAAMKATDYAQARHAVIAKALQPYDNDDPQTTGSILAIMMVR